MTDRVKRAAPFVVSGVIYLALAVGAFFALRAHGDDISSGNSLNSKDFGAPVLQSTFAADVPGTSSGAYFEDTPTTVFHWKSDQWNMVRFPEDLTQSAWSGTCPVTSSSVSASDGTVLQKITCVSTSDFRTQLITTGTNGVVFTVSGWIASDVGTKSETLGGTCGSGSATAVYCSRSDGTACTTSTSGVIAYTTPSVGTTPVRVSVTFSCSAGTTASPLIHDGVLFASVAGGGLFGGFQLVRGSVALPYQRQNGDTLVMNGTVPYGGLPTPAFPVGSGAGRTLAGSFSDSNYFNGGPSLSLTNRTVCIAFTVSQSATNPVVMNVGTTSYAQISPTQQFAFIEGGAAPGTAAGSIVTGNVLNIACGGTSGTTAYAKANGGVTSSSGGGGATDSGVVTIGRYVAGSGFAITGGVAEVWISTTPWTEANASAIEARAMSYGGTGALFLDDANTVYHAIGSAYNGTTWGTPFGNLTTVGTVPVTTVWASPQNSGTPTLDRQGYGPYTAANNFQLGSGADVLDFSGDFTACAIYMNNPLTGTLVGAGANTAGYGGWGMYVISGGTDRFDTYSSSGGLVSTSVTSATTTSGVHVFCGGRGGTTQYAEVDLGGLASTGSANNSPDTTHASRIGVLGDGSTTPFNQAGDQILEVWASTDTPTAAEFTALEQRALQQLDRYKRPIANTNASGESLQVPGPTQPTLFYAPASTAAMAPDGISSWKSSTNYLLQSGNIANAAWTAVNDAVTANQSLFADNTTTMALVNSTSQPTNSNVQQTVTVPSSTGPWTMSVWTNGSGVNSVGINVGTGSATSCSCLAIAASGGAPLSCSVATNASYGWAYITTGGLMRLSVTCSASVATTTLFGFVEAGQFQSTVGTGYFGGAQLEVGAYPTPYIPTTSAAVTRSVDVVTETLPPIALQPWCLDATVTTNHNWSTDVTAMFESIGGAYGFANSAAIFTTGGHLYVSTFDGTSTQKTFSSTAATDTVLPPGVPHRVLGCSDYTLWVDGASIAGGAGGTGTPLSSFVSPLGIGNAGSSYILNGFIRNARLCLGTSAACNASAPW